MNLRKMKLRACKIYKPTSLKAVARDAFYRHYRNLSRLLKAAHIPLFK